MKKRDNQKSVAGILPDIMQDKGWAKQLDLHSFFPIWRDLVHEDLANYAKPLKIERGVLWLEVENSAWLQQFQYEKMGLLDQLNSYLQLSQLKDIKMLLPKGKDSGADQARARSKKKVTFEKPDDKSIAAFQRQIESIEDEKCRDSLMRFWYLAQACKRNTK